MNNDEFETKLAAAGDTLEKIAAEAGLTVADFTEEEANDILSMIMGEKGASAETPAATQSTVPVAPAKVAAAQPAATEQPQFTYGEVMSEVVKFAAAQNIDLSTLPPAELDDAVNKMASFMVEQQKPEFKEKQAALQAKFAEADAMGRHMAHSFNDELAIIRKTAGEEKPKDEDEEKAKAEKKAALIAKLAAKTAGEMPAAFAAHLKGKGEKKEDEEDDEKDEKKKEAAFASKVANAAAEKLVLRGINPTNGEKFASEEERVEYAANLVLSQKGY